MITIVHGTKKKPVVSERLVDFFTKNSQAYDGFLYFGYPVIGTSEGPFPFDALLISKTTGLVVFNLVEGRDLKGFAENQDDSCNKLESKLRLHKSLMKGRNLQVAIHPVTFTSNRNDLDKFSEDEHPVCDEHSLGSWLEKCDWDHPEQFWNVLSVIQAISTIRKGQKKRDVQREGSRGAILKALEDSIANLDNQQGRAVIETVEGVQRIRGLAGSGKTIVLALKAAYLHAQHPDWKIAVTFNTRSLKGQFRQLINTFTIEQTNEEPDWDNLHIIHAWGAPGAEDRNGIYYKFCRNNGVIYHDFSSAKQSVGSEKAFDFACVQALNACTQARVQEYDAILIDEAQDFPTSFLKLCYEMLKPEKRLVYAYDELQNLGSHSLPSPEHIFGKNQDGSPCVLFTPNQDGKPQQDVILQKCYRNSRPILVTAHALGFGIYREPYLDETTGLVQSFDQPELWSEVGYKVLDGSLADGFEVTLARTEESSPRFLEDHSSLEDLIQCHCFQSQEEQYRWVVDAIRRNIVEDELLPEDIVVINPDPLTTRDAVAPIRQMLFQQGINTHLAGVDTSPDVYFRQGSVAFTGIYRAKGNEAGMVYVLNGQDCCKSYGSPTLRNRLFTAITRSKAWVRILGVGAEMQALENEFKQVKAKGFQLHFKNPTEEERKYMRTVKLDKAGAKRNLSGVLDHDIVRMLEDYRKNNSPTRETALKLKDVILEGLKNEA